MEPDGDSSERLARVRKLEKLMRTCDVAGKPGPVAEVHLPVYCRETFNAHKSDVVVNNYFRRSKSRPDKVKGIMRQRLTPAQSNLEGAETEGFSINDADITTVMSPADSTFLTDAKNPAWGALPKTDEDEVTRTTSGPEVESASENLETKGRLKTSGLSRSAPNLPALKSQPSLPVRMTKRELRRQRNKNGPMHKTHANVVLDAKEAQRMALEMELMMKLQKRLDRKQIQKLHRDRAMLQSAWLSHLLHCTVKPLGDRLVRMRDVRRQDKAARSIQNLWRRFQARERFIQTVYTKFAIRLVWWRVRLWVACARRRICAHLVRTFLNDFRDGFLG